MTSDQLRPALFKNDDGALRRQASAVADARRESGLDGLVGDLQCLVINTEADRQEAAGRELLRYTGYEFSHAFETADLARHAQLQASRGVPFLSGDLIAAGDFLFIQTCPSPFTGNSIGFMWLTGYNFDFAIYIESLNSITNVARRPGAAFAQVFTSAVAAYQSDEVSGPTEATGKQW